jgi:hypothetical protein
MISATRREHSLSLWPAGREQAGTLLLFSVLFLAVTGEAQLSQGQSQAPSTLAFTVVSTTDFEVGGQPQITISRLGSQARSEDGEAFYSLVTNKGKPKDITASLDQALPSGLALEVHVEAPESERGKGATSTGWTALGTDDRAVVQFVQKVDDARVPITYRARASADLNPGTRTFTVNYTISAAN